MSYMKEITISCDECDDTVWGGGAETIAEARKDAKRHGWRYTRKFGDQCRVCIEQRKAKR